MYVPLILEFSLYPLIVESDRKE